MGEGSAWHERASLVVNDGVEILELTLICGAMAWEAVVSQKPQLIRLEKLR
jgi:hypothetical protein